MPALVQGVIQFRFKEQGFQEKYFFKSSINTAQGALAYLQQIVYGRSAFIGSGVEIIYARASVVGPGPDARMCDLPYPLGPHPSWAGGNGPGDTIGPPNDPDTCVQQRFETAAGRWGMRYFRLMPDAWVSNKVLQQGIQQYYRMTSNQQPAGPDLGPNGGLSHLAVCQSFWSYLKQNVVIAHRVSASNYDPTEIENILPVQVTNKKTGRVFRQSRGRRVATLIQ